MSKARLLGRRVILSKKINAVSEGAENLYYRLLVASDDFGRFHADPEIIKGQVYTLRKISIPSIKNRLKELSDIGLIKLYKDDSEVYLEIVLFEKHQKFRKDIQRREDHPMPVTYLNASGTSRNASQCLGNRNRNRNNNRNGNRNRNQATESEREFESWYKDYPKKIAPVDALKAFKALRQKESLETITKARDGYKDFLKHKRVHENFEQDPMYPATFLRNEKWKDFLDFVYKPRL